MATGSFTIGAFIGNDRWRHDINNDHFGDLSDLMVVIESPVGPWPQGTPLHFVLQDLAGRMLSLEDGEHRVGRFYVDSVLMAYGGSYSPSAGTYVSIFGIFAAIRRSRSGSFTAGASFRKIFSVDAIVKGQYSFAINAVVV